MKNVKVFLSAFCIVLMAVFFSSEASAIVISSGSKAFLMCPYCGVYGYASFTSYRQATSSSSGIASCSFTCGHSVSRTTRYWSDLSRLDTSLVGFGDVGPVNCGFTGVSELAFIQCVSVEASCLLSGKIVISHLGDCNVGGEHPLYSLGHSYTETRRTPATCTTPGSDLFTCTRSGCNKTKSETIPALGHDYISKRTDPTCTTLGSIVSICSRCNDTITEELPVSYHSWDAVEMVPSVYDDDGSIIIEGYTFYTCSTCGSHYTAIAGASPPAVGLVTDVLGGEGMPDTTAALGKTFLSGLWSLFGITIPGFNFTFGQMWLGVLLASVSILVIRMIFGFGGGPRGESPRTSSTSNPRISKERRRDEY